MQCEGVQFAAQLNCRCHPTDGWPACSICGDDQVPGSPDAELLPPGVGQELITCREFQEMADAGGGFSPTECEVAQFSASGTCRCQPTEGFPACNICGDNDEVIGAPDAEIVPPFGSVDVITCAEYQEVADKDGYSPTECGVAQATVNLTCRCRPADGWPSCNICGEGGVIVDEDAVLNFPGQDPITCGDLQTEADSEGGISPRECDAAQFAAPGFCGCSGGTDPTTPAPTDAMTAAPIDSTTAPQTMAPVISTTAAPITTAPQTMSPTLDATMAPQTMAPIDGSTTAPQTTAPIDGSTTTPPTVAPIDGPTTAPQTAAPVVGPTDAPSTAPPTSGVTGPQLLTTIMIAVVSCMVTMP